MKKLTKRVLALLLSTLFIVSSVPFTALADDANYDALINAIHAYEDKMNGTVYTNMKAAYEKYITAKEYAYAYHYGEDTTLNIKTAADQLSAATAAMTAWTGTSVDSMTFNYGGEVPSDYSKNVIYASAPESFGGSAVEGSIYRFLLPQKAVLLYNGTDIIIPVMCAYHNNGGGAGNDRAPLGLYINNNERDSQNENESLKLTGVWMGRHQTTVSGGPASASAYSWQEAYNQYNEVYGTDSHSTTIPGYDQESTAATNKDNRGEKQATNNGDKWWQYINTMKYHHPVDSFSNGYRTVGFGFTGRSMRWTTLVSTNVNDWHYYSYGNNNNFSGTYYVIDYSGVDAAMNKAAPALNISGKNYLHGELNDILDAYEVLQDDPAAQGYTDNNIAEKVSSVASAIQTNVATLNNATAPVEQDNGYTSLTNALSESKPIYDTNNAGGIYTEDTFAAFKTAYEASKAEAAVVATAHFTSATTGDALDAAFKALNKKTAPSGGSGDTTYAYDETTGTVTITGPGAMDDYESGADSPLGGTDSIKEAVVDPTVTYIGAHTFDGASELTTITVPASATYGEGAFDNCPKLKTVIITGGAVEDASAPNAPWTAPSVRVVKFGVDENDFSITSIDDNVFENNKNIAVYIYNPVCNIDDTTNNTFGTNPTIYGYVPSTAYDYAKKYNYSFVSLGHEHIWNDGVVTPPTCTVAGYTTYTCTFCDATKTGNFVNALGHNWVSGTPVAPTCTEKGYTPVECSRCHKEKKENTVNALGHNYKGDVSPLYPTGAPKDTVAYKHSIGCTRCESAKEEYCSFKIDGTDGAGNIVFKCSVCGGTYLYDGGAVAGQNIVIYQDSQNEIIKTESVASGQKPVNVPEITNQQTGHKFYWVMDDVEVNPADIVINENTVFRIKDEVMKYDVTYVDVNGQDISTEKVEHGATPSNIPALPAGAVNMADEGHKVYSWDKNPETTTITEATTFTQTLTLVPHDFEDTIITPASCEEDGAMSRYCDTCGYNVENEPIEKTGHNWNETTITKVTCTTNGTVKKVCANCKKEEVETVKATGHKWDNGVITLQPTVLDYGKKTYTCTVCKTQRTERLNKISVKEATPTNAQANAAKVNKKIPKPAGITTVSNQKKKQLIISFKKVKGAQNYRVMYRKQGAKKWTYAWTGGKTTYTLKNLKNRGLYEFMFAAYTKNAKGVWERGNYSKTSYRYYYKATIKKVKTAKKAIAVAWTADKKATSYQLYYATNKDMKGAKCVNLKKNKTSYTIKKLKKGKKYYVRVRALRKVKGKNYVGEYSQRKAIKVK